MTASSEDPVLQDAYRFWVFYADSHSGSIEEPGTRSDGAALCERCNDRVQRRPGLLKRRRDSIHCSAIAVVESSSRVSRARKRHLHYRRRDICIRSFDKGPVIVV